MASHRWSENIAAFAHSKKRDYSYPPYNGQYLTGATVGLVSASSVARHVIRLLEAYNCRVLVYDPFLTQAQAHDLGVESVGLDELFASSDIVSIHAPSLPSTKNMIGERQLKSLRDGATLVNTARGSVIDHDALLNECREGRIIAALDVTTPEPLPPDSEFWNLPNVILTPHISGSGHAGYFAVGDMVQQALHNCFAGHAVPGAVRLDRWEVLA
jgi:phosphoglycerate dehydrogenase-like enzyme